MSDTTSHRDLDQRIEELVPEHIAAVQRSAREALERAFAGAAGSARKPARAPAGITAAVESGKRRAPAEMSAVAERLHHPQTTKWRPHGAHSRSTPTWINGDQL